MPPASCTRSRARRSCSAPCAVVGAGAHELFCDTDVKKQLLMQGGGFARIYGPEGSELAEPLAETEEGLLFADLDFSLIAIAKSAADPVGTTRGRTCFRLQGRNPRPHTDDRPERNRGFIRRGGVR